MNAKHYLVISGIIGGVIGSLLTALLVSPVTAKRDKFDEIECRRLTVVGTDGKSLVVLDSSLLGGQVHIHSTKLIDPNVLNLNMGFRSVMLGVDDHGGIIEIHGNQLFTPKVTLGIDSDDGGGRIAVYGKNTTAGMERSPFTRSRAAILDIDEHGGRIEAVGAGGKAILATKESGGIAHVNDHWYSGAQLRVKEHGGEVVVTDVHGIPNAWLSVTEHGAHVSVKAKGEGAAAMTINKYGNGAVYTWDKNGNLQQ